eukprot:c10735_g1_i1 orf=95-1243(+)
MAAAAAAAAAVRGVALVGAGSLSTSRRTQTKRGLASSFLPPRRLCNSRDSRSPTHLGPAAHLSVRRPLHISASATQAASPPEPPKSPAHIWLSDVAPLWRKPCFLNRKWSPTDVGIGSYMVVMHALCLYAPFVFTWQAFGVFLLFYFITGLLGITLSYHRNLSHKSFTLPKWLEYTFAYCGALAIQGDPLEWVSSHRYHHQHCDTDKDPHSPYEGFWYSHMGWLLDNNSTLERVGARSNVADMAKDPFYKFLQKTYFIHPIISAVALYAWGGVPFLIWGVAVRAVWVYHITWLVNSASHVWGSQAWKTGDLSRNNWWVAMLAFGEGWHNNHHAFEYSARHGLEWWQLDPTWYCILALEKLGLATKVKLPTKEHMKRLALDTL